MDPEKSLNLEQSHYLREKLELGHGTYNNLRKMLLPKLSLASSYSISNKVGSLLPKYDSFLQGIWANFTDLIQKTLEGFMECFVDTTYEFDKFLSEFK